MIATLLASFVAICAANPSAHAELCRGLARCHERPAACEVAVARDPRSDELRALVGRMLRGAEMSGTGGRWWVMRDSNPRLLRCERSTLPLS